MRHHDGGRAAEASLALGVPPTCVSEVDPIYGYPTSACTWYTGMFAWVADVDEDGEPDADAELTRLELHDPWDGADPAGLGRGVSMACFTEDFGPPDGTVLAPADGTVQLAEIYWIDAGVDVWWDPDDGAWDGTATRLGFR